MLGADEHLGFSAQAGHPTIMNDDHWALAHLMIMKDSR
jgi:hypothetical protein